MNLVLSLSAIVSNRRVSVSKRSLNLGGRGGLKLILLPILTFNQVIIEGGDHYWDQEGGVNY